LGSTRVRTSVLPAGPAPVARQGSRCSKQGRITPRQRGQRGGAWHKHNAAHMAQAWQTWHNH
jgi:hypothetical protein